MRMPVRRRPATDDDRSRGQSLVEFALVLPMILLLMLIAIDFGRVFLGWVGLNNCRAGSQRTTPRCNPNAWAVRRTQHYAS